ADNLTFSAWIKADATSFAHHIIWEGQAGGNGWGAEEEMHLSIGEYTTVGVSDRLSFFLGNIGDPATNTDVLALATDFTDTTNRNFVAVTASNLGTSPAAELFLNGASVATDTGTTLDTLRSNWDTDLRIGTDDSGLMRYFNGVIDEIRISSTDRDSSWIGTEYRNQNSPGTFMSFSNQTAAGVSKSLAYGISTNNSKAYGTINNQSVSGSITAGEWNHISLTYNKDAGGTDEIKLYLNGTQSATGDYATAISTNNNNLLLGDMVGLLGKMDEIRIWNDVRTQQEIRENMHRIVTPGSETNLVAYWKLNESSGTSAPDSKGSNTGTLFNMTDGDWVASTAPFGGGIVNSTTSFTSGTATLGTFSLTTTNSFDNPVDITSTEILNAPNILPAVANPLNDRYWVVDVFGTPGTYTANLTFTLPSGYLNLGDEANLNLYNRSSNSDGSWTLLISGATSMTATTVTFDGVSTLGQFTIGSSGSPLPVELVSFIGKVKDQKVYLNWSTATEVNNYGFEVERKVSSKQLAVGNWANIGFVEGHGNSNSLKEYSFIDAEVNSAGIYYYRLKQIDNDGSYEFSKTIEVNFNVPIKFELSQNYPNPFNPSTTISFNLPKSGVVTLKVYNLMGEEIKTLVEGYREAGIYTVNFNAESAVGELASGMYLYRLSTNGFTETKKLVWMKYSQ
ncbi:MAG: T9SS type A sorting domain-containing protein, partial [Bacteroidetes bacterium]|nr:T9SS type A sorting domain-containing protein [Bacteroidota bacterium]